MTPLKSITDPAFRYLPAATHSDPAAFRARMRERKRQAQQKSRPVKEARK